jgi:hypothetical protein
VFVHSCRYLELTIFYHPNVIEGLERLLHRHGQGCNGAAESDMKIYLLIMLIGTLLAAVHFTSAPDRQSETLPQ